MNNLISKKIILPEEKKTIFVIVLSYGIWGTNKRSPTEVIGYNEYLESCLNAINALIKNNYKIELIICGGAKNDTTTEAYSLYTYFKPKLKGNIGNIYIEEISLTTPANIWEAYKIIEKTVTGYGHPKVIFFCDTARNFKVKCLINIWLKQARTEEKHQNPDIFSKKRAILSWPKPVVMAFERKDISPKSNKIFQFLETMRLILCPWILNKQINKLREIREN